MDFRICPSCKQSVLDDEAQDCPFCGTSMSAKPTPSRPTPAKPVGAASKAPAAAAKPVGKSGTSRPVSNSSPAASSKASTATKEKTSNDPFDVETESLDKLYPVRPKPGGGALHQVKCPMCEKVGYVPKKLCGRKVKCYNPSCLVPVFEVPVPVEVVEDVKPAKKSFLTPNVIIMLILGMFAGGGFGAWYFFIREKPEDGLRNVLTDKEQKGVELTDDKTRAGDIRKEEVKELSVAELLQKSLKLIAEASYDETGSRRTHIRQLASKGYALVGDFPRAEENLMKITEIERRLKFQEIDPWIAISWQAFKEKNGSLSTKALDQAISLSDQLPVYGFESNMTSIEYSARLAAAGQPKEAMAFLRKFTDTSWDGLLASWIVAIRANQTFDLWREWEWRPLLVDPFPQATSVSRVLASRGMIDQALPWVDLLRSEEAQMHSLAGLLLEAELIADPTAKANIQSKVMPLVDQRPKAEQAFIHSRVALVQHYMGRDETSLVSYEKASSLLKEISLPTVSRIDDLKGIYEGRNYSQEKITLPAAGAYSNLARCCLVLKKRNEYDALVRQAVQMANLTLPSYSRIETLVQNLDKNSQGVRQDLSRALNINNATDMTSAFNTYRKNLGQINALAQRTREFEVSMLAQALLDDAEGLVRSILEENAKGDASQIPLIETRLIPAMNVIAQSKKQDDLKAFISSVTANRIFPQPDLVWTMELNLKPIMASDNVKAARDIFLTFSSERRTQKLSKSEIVLMATVYGSRLAGEKRINEAFEWVSNIRDSTAKEESGRLITSLYSLISEDRSKVQHDIIRGGYSPLETAGMHLGLVEGVVARNPGFKLDASSVGTKK